MGFYAEPIANGNAWLIFAALDPPLWVRLERRGHVFFARIALVELPSGQRALRLLSAPSLEPSAPLSETAPSSVHSLHALLEWRDLDFYS